MIYKKFVNIIESISSLFLLLFLLSHFNYNLAQSNSSINYPKSFDKIISVDFNNTTFLEVLDYLSKEVNKKFNYNKSRLPINKKLTFKFSNKSIKDIFEYLLEITNTQVRIISNGQILILPAKVYKKLKGKIIGKIVDQKNQLPLIAANIIIENNLLGTASNLDGTFEIDNLPIGNYTLKASYVGFQNNYKPDVIIRSDRITYINFEMVETPIPSAEIIVEDNLFTDNEVSNTSLTNFSAEEIRRAATIGGDISRIINSLPSLSNDNESNNIIARGGSSIENGFYLDNIEIPNINHLPIPGTTGGLFSILNLDFISDVDVYTGAFSSRFGDKLSSILDIKYREGNREETDIQFDLNIAGVSGQVEGPIDNGKASYMLFARHSFTDLILKFGDKKNDPLSFYDFQGKLVYDLDKNNQLSFINIFAYDKWNVSKEVSIDDFSNWYGNFNITQNIFGANWKYLWGSKGYSLTSLSHYYKQNKIPLNYTYNENPYIKINSTRNEFRLRNINYYSLNSLFNLEFGMEGKIISSKFDNFYSGGINALGNNFEDLIVDRTITTSKMGGFINLEWVPSLGLKFVPGIRFDYFSFNRNLHISPRFSFIYQINKKSSFTGSAGLFYQNLPLYFLANNIEFAKLQDPFSYHMVFGYNYLLFDDTKLTIEMYVKENQNLPVDPNLSSLYLLDEPISNFLYQSHSNLVMEGISNSLGIEIMIQKKLSDEFHYKISATSFRAKYRDNEKVWRSRSIDNRVLAAAEIGYKPNEDWEFSLRWNYAGGVPFTKYDIEESSTKNTGILDKQNLLKDRLPPYQNISIRVDRRLYFTSTNIILYASIWNLFNRKNVSRTGWANLQSTSVNYQQTNRLFLFGAEIEL